MGDHLEVEVGLADELPSEGVLSLQPRQAFPDASRLVAPALVLQDLRPQDLQADRIDGAFGSLHQPGRPLHFPLLESEGGPAKTVTHIPNARFFIRRLESGNLLLVRHNPPKMNQRSHLAAFLSEDDGVTWKGGLMLDVRKYVSYPDGVQAPDGTIYITYDFERTKARQILMAVFTEEDVLAGD